MIGRRPDILAGIALRRRLDREREDANFLASHQDLVRRVSDASLRRDANTWAGVDVFATRHFTPYQPNDKIDMIVAARIDLDHPLYFPDNRFTACGDCGCDLQYRPDVPQHKGALFLCICCAARRLREKEKT
jgi:hypothetical protein